MGKIIFLDVDGTLINYKLQTPASAKEAIDKARANGHRVYICTGCSKAEILQRDLPQLDGMIGANGGYVEDHGEVILHQSLTPSQVRHVTDWCRSRHMAYVLEANSARYYDDLYLEQGPEANARYREGKGAKNVDRAAQKQRILEQYTYIRHEDAARDDVNKISFVLRSYQDHLDSIDEFPDMIAHTWGGVGETAIYGDLAPKGITKRYAIEQLLAHLGASREDTISFGDAKIDLSMFELCAYNVAMGNGGEEIKAAADYVTDDVDADGLYNAFRYLKLID